MVTVGILVYNWNAFRNTSFFGFFCGSGIHECATKSDLLFPFPFWGFLSRSLNYGISVNLMYTHTNGTVVLENLRSSNMGYPTNI
uniref:Uncharacterized protein n=1 Tax=Octopus bimaculoides TaxID=37653 RepID=A0A0L8HLN8_OCTBM